MLVDNFVNEGSIWLFNFVFRQKAPNCYKRYSLLNITQVTKHTATGIGLRYVAVWKRDITSLVAVRLGRERSIYFTSDKRVFRK